MTTLRLLADDLTGALDTAAQFVGLTGAVPVFWSAAVPATGSAACDSGTREMTAAAAAERVAAMAGMLKPAPGRLAFKKIDSLLRGNSGIELAACLGAAAPRHCIIAPAFPFQGRATRGGLQLTLDERAGWRNVGEDLAATLTGAGVVLTLARPGDPLPGGASLWDAETDADLASIARAGLAAGEGVLWCGSSGLAGALAGQGASVAAPLARPLLGLFGSEHPVTMAQLLAAEGHFLRLPDGGPAGAALLSGRLEAAGVALAGFEIKPGTGRAEAAAIIAREMASLVGRIEPPRTLVVAGGETLRALCLLLEAGRLDVQGQILPGIPLSILRGGRWDGVTVVSKSGAFGEAGLLRQLLTDTPCIKEFSA